MSETCIWCGGRAEIVTETVAVTMQRGPYAGETVEYEAIFTRCTENVHTYQEEGGEEEQEDGWVSAEQWKRNTKALQDALRARYGARK